MAKLGEILRAQRERKGITLDQAAVDTRIREKFLRALEAGDYQTLPGAVYTKGFLRNYAEYLDVDTDELIALYQSERPGAEPPRAFEPMRPIMKRNLILTPAVLVPLVVVAGIVLFVSYLYYQFSSFAVPPRLEVLDPPGDAIAQSSDYVIKGRTVTDGKITVSLVPGPERITDIHPASDGSFSATIQLKPGANHVDVEVLDAAGKVSRVSRTILLDSAVVVPAGPQLIVEQPANGTSYTNAPVTVSGRVDRGVTVLLVNGQQATVGSDGRFSVTVNFTQGQQTVRVVARTAAGAEVQETRTVAVGYTTTFVTVRVTGGDAWLLATVDGAQAPNTNRIFANGTTVTFSGKQVLLKTGNAGVTFVTYNGQDLGKLGDVGQVVEKQFATP